ncbi:MAG: hypothetical protein CMF66_07105 [Magnetovibrio sp.]|nr:hypothetical protein [Magnetovibrio sp.]
MKTVAEHLKPPFVAAIMLDVIQAGGDDGPSPSDELVSIAPAQEGFLGLETTCDNQGRWVSISYWRDHTCFISWRKAGIAHVARLFNGLDLEAACKFRVSNVEEPVMPSKQFMAPERAIPNSARERRSGFGSKVFNAFPAIAELLGYEHAR